MKVNFREAKSIITKSNIPNIDYVINPYVGCQHGCIYCYAEFMKRFTHHGGDHWGEFLDVKQIDWNKIKPQKYNKSSILLSSVTDPYTPAEKQYQNTRKILEHLIGTEAQIEILTKSRLVTRDIDLFTQFRNIKVGISLNTLDEKIARLLEPFASAPVDRLNALKEVAEQGISTWIFISPIFPFVSDWESIIKSGKEITKDFHFENLNFRGHNIPRILAFIQQNFSDLVPFYRELRYNTEYWDTLEDQIQQYGIQQGIETQIAFHHGGFSNK